MSQSAQWQAVALLDRQFRANLAVLEQARPELASQVNGVQTPAEYLLCSEEAKLVLARRWPDGRIEWLPNSLPPQAAADVAGKLCPTGKCTQPILVSGLDQGWLWNNLFAMPIGSSGAPGHRPPLFFLCSDIERFWLALHIHDWRALLADARVQIHCGTDALAKLRQSLIDHPQLPLPRLSVTVDPSIWPANTNIDTVHHSVLQALSVRYQQTARNLQQGYGNFDPADLALRIREQQPLRILGITSRFTTFLQYSMRDWLASMESLGHSTRLVIEKADHEQFSAVVVAEACDQFKPDLVLAIDHFRTELPGLPATVPCVMWVQDRLPNIYAAKAGAAQGPLDFVIGQSRVELVHTFGYPSRRFMPAMIGTNESRFTPTPATSEELAAHGCEVSFVSHCTVPADVILKNEIDRINSPVATSLLRAVFDELQGIYTSGKAVTQPRQIEQMIHDAMKATQSSVVDPRPLYDFFTHRINNALFRHQSLGWLADMGVDLHLYGRGWETHPRFSKFAKGVANNEHQLAAIHRASRINMQITPFGSAHQRLFDGLAAGGFFLIKGVPGDRFDQILRSLWQWCESHGIQHDTDLTRRANDQVRAWLQEAAELDGQVLLGRGYDFVSELAVTAAEGFTRSSGTLWPEFNQVAFHTEAQLRERVAFFLAQPEKSEEISSSMRQRVLECLTYKAVSRRTLKLIADNLVESPIATVAA